MNIGLGIGIPFAKSQIWLSLFDPSKLFTAGVNGVWYDPSDLTTLYQNAAGTLPVTAVEQPVGLMLDKSNGLVLGPELVTNGGFGADTGWSKGVGWEISGGAASINGTNTASSLISQSMTLASGKWYEVRLDVLSNTSGRLRLNSTLFPVTSLSVATYSWIFQAATTTADFRIEARDAGTIASIDNISVRELPGNHAFNPSGNSANFPVLSARYNLLTKTEDFSDAAWRKGNVTITPDADGVADKWIPNTTISGHPVQQSVTVTPNTQYKLSVKIKKDGYRFFYFGQVGGPNTARIFDLDTGSYGTSVGSATYTSELLSDGYYLLTMTFTVGAAVTSITIEGSSQPITGFSTFAGDGVSGALVKDADLRVANDALNQPAYQRVNTSTDYDTVGFKPYLRFNGVSQWLQTNSIDFTYGDKMFVCAGVRKLSDAATGLLTEFSASTATNAGSFFVALPIASTASYRFESKGTVISSASSLFAAYPAPITNVLTGIGDISGDQAILRVNGVQAASSTADQGTGNFGNYPLYIGARAGSSLWFNGRLYGMVIVGKQASSNEIQDTEKYMNLKTAAYN